MKFFCPSIFSAGIAIAVAVPAFAQTPTFELATSLAGPRPHEMKILGFAPGMTKDEAIAQGATNNHKLVESTGNLSLTKSSKTLAWKVTTDLNSDHGGYSNYYANQSVKSFDWVRLNLTSPATGGVVSGIGRTVRLPITDTTYELEAIIAQLTETMGFAPERYTTPRAETVWAVDANGAKVDPKTCLDSVPFSYINPQDREKTDPCAARYTLAEMADTSWGHRTFSFRIDDLAVIRADNLAMSQQIDAAFDAPVAKTAAPL